jgi:hypothetical protein
MSVRAGPHALPAKRVTDADRSACATTWAGTAVRRTRREAMAKQSSKGGGTGGQEKLPRNMQALLVKRQKALAALSDAEANVAAQHKALAQIHSKLISKTGVAHIIPIKEYDARW